VCVLCKAQPEEKERPGVRTVRSYPPELPTKRRARLARSPAHVAKAADAASCDYTGCLPAHIHVRACVSGCYANTKREDATLGRGAWVAVAGYCSSTMRGQAWQQQEPRTTLSWLPRAVRLKRAPGAHRATCTFLLLLRTTGKRKSRVLEHPKSVIISSPGRGGQSSLVPTRPWRLLDMP